MYIGVNQTYSFIRDGMALDLDLEQMLTENQKGPANFVFIA